MDVMDSSLSMDVLIPEFLVLHPMEKQLVTQYAPYLAARAQRFSHTFYEHVLQEDEVSSALTGHDMELLMKNMVRHYRNILLHDYDVSMRNILHHVGKAHQRIGLPIHWLVATYSLYAMDLDAGIEILSGISEGESAILRQAMIKRLQLDMFWCLEGFGDAEKALIACRNAFYQVLAEANRLFSVSVDARLEDVFQILTDSIANRIGCMCVWAGLVSEQEGSVKVLAASGVAAHMTNNLHISIDASVSEGQGPFGIALRTVIPQITELPVGLRLGPWETFVRENGLGGGMAAIPFQTRDGQVGIIGLHQGVNSSFPIGVMDLMKGLAMDLSTFLDRRLEAIKLSNLRRYQIILAELQQKFLEYPPPERLFESVVQALVQGTDALGAFVAVPPEPDGQWLRIVAVDARSEDHQRALRRLTPSIDPNNRPYGQLVAARVYREGNSVVVNPAEDSDLQIIQNSDSSFWSTKSVGGWPIFEEDKKSPSAVLVVAGPVDRYFTSEFRVFMDQVIASIQIVLAQHKNHQEIVRLGLCDPLTGLPNRMSFGNYAIKAITRAEQEQRMLAIGILDLDGFREWNDTFGHQAGDSLLQDLVMRLQGVMRPEQGLGRLGSDEFGLCVFINRPDDLVNISKTVLEAVSSVDHHVGPVTGSLGWAMYPDDGKTYSTLLTYADQALFGAKEEGRNSFRMFGGNIAKKLARRLHVRQTFPAALKSGEIQFFLQPQVDGLTGRVDGVEMLARWKGPKGWISPIDFMPEVERDPNLIRLMGNHVLREAGALQDRLRDSGLSLRVSMNIGARHFLHPDFVADVKSCFMGRPGKGVVIEITETTALIDLDHAMVVIRDLKKMGFTVSLDDFGTGYSSLSHAANLPVDELKLDQHFIRRFRTDPNVFAVAGAIIQLGALSGRLVIAEGIEDQEDLALWARMGGYRLQGYLLSPPLPEKAFIEWAQQTDLSHPRFPRAYPIEDLPLLAYVFMNPDGYQHCVAHQSSVCFCPLERWFAERKGHYGHLPSWNWAYDAYCDTVPLFAQSNQAPVDWGVSLKPFKEALKMLSAEVDGCLR